MSTLYWVLFGFLFLVALFAPIWIQIVAIRYGWKGDRADKSDPVVADQTLRRRPRQRL